MNTSFLGGIWQYVSKTLKKMYDNLVVCSQQFIIRKQLEKRARSYVQGVHHGTVYISKSGYEYKLKHIYTLQYYAPLKDSDIDLFYSHGKISKICGGKKSDYFCKKKKSKIKLKRLKSETLKCYWWLVFSSGEIWDDFFPLFSLSLSALSNFFTLITCYFEKKNGCGHFET